MGLIIEIIFGIVFIIIILANIKLYSTKKNLTKIVNPLNLSGFEVVRNICNAKNNEDIHIIKKQGSLANYYNYERNVMKLSSDVFDGENAYATTISSILAIETTKPKDCQTHKFTAFLVMLSYLIIILGAILNNGLFFHIGMIIFIIAFGLEVLTLTTMIKDSELNEIFNFLKKVKVIPNDKEYITNIKNLLNLYIARLPYHFLEFFI